MQPNRVLDLYSCAGGAAMGLHRAWPKATIVGVDIVNQPRYPFMSSWEMPWSTHWKDLISFWASPPCQHFSTAGLSHRMNGGKYQNLIEATRQRLVENGKPWVMENVTNAPIRRDAVLRGSHFGLKVVRHRAFEFWEP